MMESIFQIGINFILFLQGFGDWIFTPMKFFTFLGDEEFYLLITPVLYWCIDTGIGIRTALMLMVSSSIYNYGKWIFHTPRPYWYSRQVKIFKAESSFGMPSGHSTSAVTIWGYLAASFRKTWFLIVAIGLMIMIGLSRMVLAVHFPHDVLFGWTLGIVILWGYIKAEPKVTRWLHSKTPTSKILISFLVSMVMIVIGILVLIPLSDWSIPATWLENAAIAFPDEPQINPVSLSGEITIAGTFFGLTAGHILLFANRGYSSKGEWWQQILRYLLGIVGVFAIWAGLDKIFPDGNNFIPYFFRYLRYGLVGFWITFLAPKIFIRLKVAEPLKD